MSKNYMPCTVHLVERYVAAVCVAVCMPLVVSYKQDSDFLFCF